MARWDSYCCPVCNTWSESWSEHSTRIFGGERPVTPSQAAPSPYGLLEDIQALMTDLTMDRLLTRQEIRDRLNSMLRKK